MAHLILFADVNFRGDHKHVLDATESLAFMEDGECIADCDWPSSVSSIVILSGSWRFFADENFQKSYEVILGPGLYRFVSTYKLENDHIRSLQPVDDAPTMSGELTALVTLFEHVNFRGNHVHLVEAQANLNSSVDFAGITSSLVVELGNWSFYSDTEFDGSYSAQPVVGPGIYPATTDVGIGNDSIVSLQPVDPVATLSSAVDNHVHHSMFSPERARSVVETVERELLTPVGLRTLNRSDPRYRATYEGNQFSRDSAYHQGTVWPWLLGPFVAAYVRVNDGTAQSRARAHDLLRGIEQHLTVAGLWQISEIFEADLPHHPHGCFTQAWSVAELLRALCEDIYQVRPSVHGKLAVAG